MGGDERTSGERSARSVALSVASAERRERGASRARSVASASVHYWYPITPLYECARYANESSVSRTSPSTSRVAAPSTAAPLLLFFVPYA